jgi:hypothetical protein
MAYVIEMPPVVIQEIRDYERTTGRSLEARIVEFIKNELRRRREADEWETKFDRLVESSSSRMSGTDAYKFNRADAYSDGEFA